jgi:hypothetical protein
MLSWRQWLTPIILTSKETEIRRIRIGGQLRQKESKTLSQKHPKQKMAGEWLK